jgi:A/G-specific adenine glycosylase
MNFSDELTQWYHINKRALPWRNTTDAYIIWLSEIILQQTRVEQGMPYFHRFLEKYPDVKAFAAASEDEILTLWQGLGYYSRGRNMLKTARRVADIYNGAFPTKYEQLIKLKGIGEYTAAAIASFSSNEAKAVVDGNVYRVLSRYFGIDEPINSTKGKKFFQELADNVLNHDHPGLHNQALMEFGAMLCKPRNPDCAICPVREGCYAHQYNLVTELPKKLKTVRVRDRYFNYFLISDGNGLWVSKRDDKDIWANMYDLPMIESASFLSAQEVMAIPATRELFGNNIATIATFPFKKHILTHQRIHAQFIQIAIPPDIKLKQKYFYKKISDLENLALPKIIFLFLNHFFNL